MNIAKYNGSRHKLKLVGHKDVTLYEMQRQDDIGHLKQAK